MLVNQSVRDLLEAFAAPAPTPGGGSASALAGAVGAGLLRMVSTLPRTRSGKAEDRATLDRIAAALAAIQQRLTEAIDDDSSAYGLVMAAYKLPKRDDGERTARTAAIQQALVAAAEVPLSVMRLAASALEHAETVAALGHPAAATDVGAGAALLRAAVHGAHLNVGVNIGTVTNREYADRVAADAARLATGAAARYAAVEALLARS